MEIIVAVLLTIANIVSVLYLFAKISTKYGHDGLPLFMLSVIVGMSLNIGLFILYLRFTR